MNQDQIKGNWEQLKGMAKQSWGRLTDDDFTKAEGSVDKLFGIIHEKFGESTEAIRAKLDPQGQYSQNKSSISRADHAEDAVGRMETQLAHWGATLDGLVHKAEKAGSDVKADYHKRLDELKLKYQAAQKKLSDLRAAGHEKWDTFKADIEVVWKDLEAAFKKLAN
jgi:uncharacterized protein YjbJ (UPF0337 family)